MHIELQKNNGKIEWELTTRRPETPTTIWDIIKQLKSKKNNEIFVSRDQEWFKNIHTLNLRRHKKLSNKEIKGALIIEDEESWKTYYDITPKESKE